MCEGLSVPVSEQGITKDRYMLIPRTLVFLTRDDQVLLLKGSPKKRLWSNLYNGVGGHVDRGEDVIGAARRETREETGLDPDCLWLCGVLIVDTQQTPGISLFIFKGECENGDPRPSREGTAQWVPVSKVNELPLVEDLYTLLPRVLAMQPGDVPFSALTIYNQDGKATITFSNP